MAVVTSPGWFREFLNAGYSAARTYFTACTRYPPDGFVFNIICSLGIIGYIIGMIQIMPELAEACEWGFFARLFFYGLAHWMFIAFYSHVILMHVRHSSITDKLLICSPPKRNFPDVDLANSAVFNHRDRAKPRTEGDFSGYDAKIAGVWHYCSICSIFVPPKTWHCKICNTCILRRDHHCTLAMTCIGHENQSHFLGFIFYMAAGCTYGNLINISHHVWVYNEPLLSYAFRISTLALIFWNKSITIVNILSGIGLMGMFTAWAFFGFNFAHALQKRTAVDWSKGIRKDEKYSLSNLRDFLGSWPLLRIICPFHRTNVYEGCLSHSDFEEMSHVKYQRFPLAEIETRNQSMFLT